MPPTQVGGGDGTPPDANPRLGRFAIGTTAGALGLSTPPVAKAIERLSGAGILAEVTGRRRDRVYVYRRYLDLLADGTEPLGPDQVA